MIIILVPILLLIFIAVEVLILIYNGPSVPVPVIDRTPIVIGNGKPLRYVIMGDSTAAGQGGDYQEGIALSTANYLAETRQVSFLNTAVSGARTKDILEDQLADALKHNPDIVMIVVGSNDATHLTQVKSLESDLHTTIDKLITNNCDIKVVLTGSAAMGAVPRIPQPLRYLLGQRVKKLNKKFQNVIGDYNLTFAPIAEKTGPIFAADHGLFAQDKFHPNTKGYDVWTPVLNNALNDAILNQPRHCA